MEALSRLQLYRNLLERNEFTGTYRIVLEVNINILSGIEELFLSQDDFPDQKAIKDPAIWNYLAYNISYTRNSFGYDRDVERLLRKLEKLLREYEGRREDYAQNSRNLFNKILNELGTYNTKFLDEGQMPIGNREKKDRPQVFLSHAYDDRLYALALFEYFYQRGIYLYVDWMHQGKMDDGIVLKRDLQNELDNSVQLLFLRTVNSELDIQGKHMLRSWCAWELGNFYRKESTEKYMLNLYSVESYKKNINIQLHGLKLYTGINGGLLNGDVIVP